MRYIKILNFIKIYQFNIYKVISLIDKRQTEPEKEDESNGGGFSFSFTKNPFKHDSTDDEGDDGKGEDDYKFKLIPNAKQTSEDDDKLFTPLGDSRIEGQ